jgi:hypothetical protein
VNLSKGFARIQILRFSFSSILYLIVTCAGLVLAVGASRGFDFIDEGVYYTSTMHPIEVPDRQTTDLIFGRVLATAAGLIKSRCEITVLNLDRSIIGFPSAGRRTPLQAPQN